MLKCILFIIAFSLVFQSSEQLKFSNLRLKLIKIVKITDAEMSVVDLEESDKYVLRAESFTLHKDFEITLVFPDNTFKNVKSGFSKYRNKTGVLVFDIRSKKAIAFRCFDDGQPDNSTRISYNSYAHTA